MDGESTSAARVAVRGAVALSAVVVLGVAGCVWSVTDEFDDRIATSDAVSAAVVPRRAEGPFTALLVGLDSRTDNSGEPLPPDVLAQLHAGADEGQLNTDTIILLHVPRGPRPQAVAISFPRDAYVEIAGDRGTHKINTAYGRGVADAEEALAGRVLLPAERERRTRDAGRRALVATMQELAGVGVDRFAEVNLAGFVEITDALGGVPVCLNTAVRETRSGIDLPAGPQLVRGADALAFVRQRHGLDDGDLDRIGRQQAFLAGLTSTVASSATMRDPARLQRLVRAAGRYVVLDRGWTISELIGQLRRVAAGDLTFRTVPTGTSALLTGGDGIAIQVDPDEVRRFVRAWMPEAPVHPGTPPRATADPTRTRRAGVPSSTANDAGRRSTPTSSPARTPRPAAPIAADGVPCVN